MITLRPAAERGRTSTSWLDSRHTFSFGEYFDQTHMGFRVLRVINDDRVAAGARLSHARARRHGDPQLRARRRARPPRQHGHRFGDSPRRRATHERGHRRPPQRAERVARRAGSLPADLDHPRAPRPAAGLRAKALRAGGQARPPVPGRIQRRARRLGDDPPGRLALRHDPGPRRARRAPPGPGALRLGSGRRRHGRAGRPADGRRRRGRDRVAGGALADRHRPGRRGAAVRPGLRTL